MHLALYRKYRPKNFDEVVAQKHITTTLKNQISSGEISHAYLFNGTRGTGKTSIAKIFAKAINCENPETGNPCFACKTCLALEEQNNMDVLEIDAASNNRVDEIRELREKVKYPPVNGKYKVYIIDEVHMLTDSAFNALLKTLEEPPAHVVFILATTEIQKLPATILSRCMRFDFKLVGQQELADHIANLFNKENVKYEPAAVQVLAGLGEGSVRDALSVADMVVSFSNKNVTYQAVIDSVGAIDKKIIFKIGQNILSGNAKDVIPEIDNIISQGKNVTQIAKDLTAFFRDVAVIKTTNSYKTILNLPADLLSVLEGIAADVTIERVIYNLKQFSGLENEFRNTLNPRLVLEVTALNQTASTESDILKRIEELEKLVFNPHFSDKKSTKSMNLQSNVNKNTITVNPEDMVIDNRVKNVEKAVSEKTIVSEIGNKPDQNTKMQNTDLELQNLIENELKNSAVYDDSYFVSEDVIVQTGGSFGVLENHEKPETFLAEELIKKADNQLNEKWLYGQILIELRKKSEYSVHGMLGSDVEFEIENDNLIINFGDKSKHDRMQNPRHLQIIADILTELDIKLKLVLKLDVAMSQKKDTIESKLKKIFGNKLIIE